MSQDNYSGYLLLNKKSGLTSFESLFAVKKLFGTNKVCHTGTLDSFAEGLLIVLVGRAVKLSAWFLKQDKKYTATIQFGEETDTLDPFGEVIASAAPCTMEAFERVIPSFIGDIMQAPPAYSAVHVDGKRAHELAREGKPPRMKERPVHIYSIELKTWTPGGAVIEVHCSSGTYIRSLARDMALAAGSRGRLKALRRTAVGGFSAEEASGSPEIKDLRPITAELFAKLSIPVITLAGRDASGFANGKTEVLSRIKQPEDGETSLAVFGRQPDGKTAFAGMLLNEKGRWKYGYVNG
jgi:tRNA pseudouridine55 synthase